MRLGKRHVKIQVLPSLHVHKANLPLHTQISRAVQNLVLCQRYIGRKKQTSIANRFDSPTTRADRAKARLFVYENFHAIQSAIENFPAVAQNATATSATAPENAKSDAFGLYSLTSPSDLQQLLAQIQSYAKRRYVRLCTAKQLANDKRSSSDIDALSPKTSIAISSALVHNIVLAYSHSFYLGKTSREIDMRFLSSLASFDRHNRYLQFTKDLLTSCFFAPNQKPSNSIRVREASQQPPCLNRDAMRPREMLSSTHIATALRIISHKRLASDQTLSVSLCASLQRHAKLPVMFSFRTPLTSRQALSCLRSLHRMRVFHDVLRDVLVYMASLPLRAEQRSKFIGRRVSPLDVNHFIEALALVVPNKDLISDEDFAQFLRRVFLDTESIEPRTAAQLIALMSQREIQCLYPSSEETSTEDQKRNTSDQASRFYTKEEKSEEVIFSVQNDNTNIISDALRIIDSVVIQKLPGMTVFDVSRVVRGMASDFVGIGSEAMWRTLLKRVNELYAVRVPRLEGPRNSGELSTRSEYPLNLRKAQKCKPISRVARQRALLNAHATLLALLPRLEARQNALIDEDEASVEISSSLLGEIARHIPQKDLVKHRKLFSETILKLRRAFCDFPELYDINPGLWEAVKSAKARDPLRGARSLYRTPQGLARAPKSANRSGSQGRDMRTAARERLLATRKRVRRKTFFDFYRTQAAKAGVARLK